MKRNQVKFPLLLLLALFLSAFSLFGCGGSSDSPSVTPDTTDTTKPSVSAFTVPATSTSFTISGINLVATDNVGVTGYLITESATPPAAASVNLTTSPTTYTAATEGAKTLYAWARDAAGNVSALSAGKPCTVDVAYLYATNSATLIDLVYGTNYTGIDTWGSGAVLNNAYALDATYNPVFSVNNAASTWGGSGAVAFNGFTAGTLNSYTALHFKFKADTDTAVNVKFPGASPTTKEEIIYNVSSAISLGNGWYEFTIRLANHGSLSASTEFALIATGNFYVTDIYFDNATLAVPKAGDIDGGGSFYLKSGDGNNQIDLRYGTEYQGISVWSSGTVIADITDATYGAVWSMTPGSGWGRSAAAIAFTGFTAGSFSNYTTLKFKFNPGGVYTAISVKFPGATTEEVAYSLATYGSAIGTTGWYEMTLPIATKHGSMSTTTEFAILTDGTTDFKVTDISFR